MRERFRRFIQDRFLSVAFLLALLVNIATCILIYMRVTPSEQPIPLHYNTYFGIDAIGPWFAYYYLPLGSVGFLLMNTVMAFVLLLRDRVLARMTLGVAVGVAVFIFLSTFSAIQLLL